MISGLLIYVVWVVGGSVNVSRPRLYIHLHIYFAYILQILIKTDVCNYTDSLNKFLFTQDNLFYYFSLSFVHVKFRIIRTKRVYTEMGDHLQRYGWFSSLNCKWSVLDEAKIIQKPTGQRPQNSFTQCSEQEKKKTTKLSFEALNLSASRKINDWSSWNRNLHDIIYKKWIVTRASFYRRQITRDPQFVTECESQSQTGQRLAGMPRRRAILTVMDCLYLGFGYKSKTEVNSTEGSNNSEGSIRFPHPGWETG